MKYNATQVEHLAAEYVLGTLHGAARRRFARLVAERADVRFEVWRWERRLNRLAVGLEPKKAPSRVWKNIRGRIGAGQGGRVNAGGWWRAFRVAVPAALAAAWLAIVFTSVPVANERLAVFENDNSATEWVVSADLNAGQLQTRGVNVVPPDAGTAYELWVLPASGPPQSLGLLPVTAGPVVTEISPALVAALADAGHLAISIEPQGGSPTGAPTGPIIGKASLVTM